MREARGARNNYDPYDPKFGSNNEAANQTLANIEAELALYIARKYSLLLVYTSVTNRDVFLEIKPTIDVYYRNKNNVTSDGTLLKSKRGGSAT